MKCLKRPTKSILTQKILPEIKGQIEEADNQVSEVISDLVDRAEEILTQNPQQKKRYKIYRTEESRKQRGIENHPLLPGCSSTCSKQYSKKFKRGR